MFQHPLSHPMTSRHSPCWTPTFHVSMLEPATLNLIPDCIQPPPLPITFNDELEFEISEILDSNIDNCCHACKLLYLVCWTGYEGTDNLMDRNLMDTCFRTWTCFCVDFHTAYPAKSHPLSSLLSTSRFLVFFMFFEDHIVFYVQIILILSNAMSFLHLHLGPLPDSFLDSFPDSFAAVMSCNTHKLLLISFQPIVKNGFSDPTKVQEG